MGARFSGSMLGLLLLLAPASVQANGITYDCDTAADHFSELQLPSPLPAFKATGMVQLNAMAGSAAYIPMVRIEIASSSAPGKSPDASAGFKLSALPVNPKKSPTGAAAIQMLSFSANSAEDEMLPLSMMTKLGTPETFSLTYDDQGIVVVLGKESRTFPKKLTNPVLRVICSTGEFLITDLAISPLP